MNDHITLHLSSGQAPKNSLLTILKNYASKFWHNLSRTIASILCMLLQLLRPLLGPGNICPFTVGCTQYAVMQLQEVQTQEISLQLAIINITKRLALCNPITNLFKKNRPLH